MGVALVVVAAVALPLPLSALVLAAVVLVNRATVLLLGRLDAGPAVEIEVPLPSGASSCVPTSVPVVEVEDIGRLVAFLGLVTIPDTWRIALSSGSAKIRALRLAVDILEK